MPGLDRMPRLATGVSGRAWASCPASAISHVCARRSRFPHLGPGVNPAGARIIVVIAFLTPSTPLPDAPPSCVGVYGLHRADQRFLLVLLQLEVVEGLLEAGGLVHICDIDDDPGGFSGGGAAQIVEVDGGICGLDGEDVLVNVFIVQGLWKGKVWRAPALSEARDLRSSQQSCKVALG